MVPSGDEWPGVIVTPEAPSDSSVIARRDLRIQDEAHSLKILIQIHTPRLADKDFSCRYDVLGFDEPVSRAVYNESMIICEPPTPSERALPIDLRWDSRPSDCD
jgi:hypothetical protein